MVLCLSSKFVYISPQIIIIFFYPLVARSNQTKNAPFSLFLAVAQETFICILHFIQFQMTVINFRFVAKPVNEKIPPDGTISIMEDSAYERFKNDTHPSG